MLNKELYENREKLLRDQKYGAQYGNFDNVRSKINENGTKTNFTMAGPNLMNSKTFNIGSGKEKELKNRTIGTIEDEIVKIGLAQIKDIFVNWDYIRKETGEVRNIYLMFQGHSRGAVAVLRGSAKLNHDLYEKYGKKGGDYKTFYEAINYEVILLEPVPGLKDQHGVNMDIDLLKNKTFFALNGLPKEGYRPLGVKAESVVFLSLYQNYSTAFDPCRVLNSKRVVLTLTDHTINLDKIDYSQGKRDGKSHKMPYFYYDESKKEIIAYRNSGLNQLPEGVFIADERGVLYEIENMKGYEDIVKKNILRNNKSTLKPQTWGPDGRFNMVKDVVKSCLARKGQMSLWEEISYISTNNNNNKINGIDKKQINKDGNEK